MDLIAFRINMYKGIIDSGWIDVNSLTVLVGKNESGKTSLLKALHKLNPASSEPYDIENEWPRAHQANRNQEHVVCQARFQLSNREKSFLSKTISSEKFPDIIEVSRNYMGQLEVKVEGDIFSEILRSTDFTKIFDSLPEVRGELGLRFTQRVDKCLKDAMDSAHKRDYGQLKDLADRQELYLSEGLTPSGVRREIQINFIRQYRQVLQNLLQELEPLSVVQVTVNRYVRRRLPTFIYMDDYRIFSGTMQLDKIKNRQNEERLTEADKTFLTLLNLSELNLDELVQFNSEAKIVQRHYDLENGANILTAKFSNRLRQRNYEIEYRVDGHLFVTYVKDNHDSALIKLEERSRGFQWFFSFDLMLMHGSENEFKDSIVLLDEPRFTSSSRSPKKSTCLP